MKNFLVKYVFGFITALIASVGDTIAENANLFVNIVKDIGLALIDGNPDNKAQLKAIIKKYRPQLIELLFGLLREEAEEHLAAKGASLGEMEKQMILAQPEIMALTRNEYTKENPNFQTMLETVLTEKKVREYPYLVGLTVPIV